MTIDSPPSTRKRDLIYSPPTSQNNFNSCFQNYYHGHNYLNPNPKYITNVKANVNHFQLRDLLQIDQANGDVYFTKSYSLWKLSQFDSMAKSTKSFEVLKPDYSPRCFNVTNNGFMVTGGLMTSAYKIFYSNIEGVNMPNGTRPQKGLFTFFNGDLGTSKTVKVGEMINNAVLIDHQDNASVKSYVCNNDSSLYCLDILNNERIVNTEKIVCENDISLNNVVKSPTSNLLTVTGDTSLIYLVDPTAGENMVVNKLQTDNDSGFGISYHPNGNMFSVAFQNGTCLLYDLRNLSNPIHTITSTRPGHQSGAFRACKFSNSSFSDLLVVSEHVGRAHLIDLRNLNDESHQVIVFPFALDQFGDFKAGPYESNKKSDTETHGVSPIYGDVFDSNDIKFNAPLVYDYDYLTNINPKLFKHYTYSPEVKQSLPSMPSPGTSPTNTSQYNSIDRIYNVDNDFDSSPSMYHNSDNHIHGEMELSGVDWYNDKLLIGCENGGVISWDINYIGRRSFGSFSFV